MTPGEQNILKALIAVAWADGAVEAPEEGVLDELLSGFGATTDELRTFIEYAKEKRTLEDAPLAALEDEDKEVLLVNAAVLTNADGVQSDAEKALLDKLVKLLGFADDKAKALIESAKDGALVLPSRALEEGA